MEERSPVLFIKEFTVPATKLELNFWIVNDEEIFWFEINKWELFIGSWKGGE